MVTASAGLLHMAPITVIVNRFFPWQMLAAGGCDPAFMSQCKNKLDLKRLAIIVSPKKGV
jgi:hypothetical protein